jgi:hypothetical protein
MKSLLATFIVLALTLLGLTGVPACVGGMKTGTEMKMEKGGAKDGDASVMEPDKPMMKKPSDAMMERRNSGGSRMARLVGAGDHHATGNVTMMTDQNGIVILRLNDIAVDRVPDG